MFLFARVLLCHRTLAYEYLAFLQSSAPPTVSELATAWFFFKLGRDQQAQDSTSDHLWAQYLHNTSLYCDDSITSFASAKKLGVCIVC